MKHALSWRIALTTVILAAAVYILLPTFLLPAPTSKEEKVAPKEGIASILPDRRVNLGLDLMGGIHLTLEVEVEKALTAILADQGRELMRNANAEGIATTRPVLMPNGNLEFTLGDAKREADLRELIAKSFDSLTVLGTQPAAEGRIKFSVGMSSAERSRLEGMTVDQALSTIRNRIDQFGVAEPDIRRQQGSNRLVIQLPGMSDPERAVSIIGQTAVLEFCLVRTDVDPYSGRVPSGVRVLPMDDRRGEEGGESARLMAVEAQPVLTGDRIRNALPSFDQYGSAEVSISFDRRGAEIFSEVTGNNVEGFLAIVLDDKIYSAPRINGKISGGQAVITGNFSVEEAKDLALVLRAGSLPAPVVVLEQRTVGPSLGQESIDMGVKATLIGGIAVIVFMTVYYGISGIIANIMLVLDVVLILAGMAAFGATLTLPGIAGIVLTIGMAVDANVLIFERIREEMRRGLTPLAAVEAGFSRAMLAITDSNLTTVIAALILYQFGTGPIRGFAVTLVIGIIASMFTAIFVSRIIFDIWMSKPGRKLSI